MSDKNATEKTAVALKIPLLLAMKSLSSFFVGRAPPADWSDGRYRDSCLPASGWAVFLSGCLYGGAAPDSLRLSNLDQAAVMHRQNDRAITHPAKRLENLAQEFPLVGGQIFIEFRHIESAREASCSDIPLAPF